jgi:hypothetical protein
MTTGPFEPEGGQDPDPPNLRLLLQELRYHLADLFDHLPDDAEVTLRNRALLRAVRRYRQAHFTDEDD